MKLKGTQLWVLALLFDGHNGLTAYPSMSGVGTPTTSSTCYACIRGGWTWFYKSGKPYFTGDATTIGTDGSDGFGKCCNPADAGSYDSTKCPGIYSNAASTAETLSNANTINSKTFVIKDYSLAACPQDTAICGATNTFVFTNADSAKKNIYIKNLNKNQKCTYLIKAIADAPTFRITGTGLSAT